MENLQFSTEEESLKFYEERYNVGYMEDWDPAKKKKVAELILGLNLPSHGRALDFGCGNGVLTAVIKAALPGWEVYGCDVSEVAIDNAKERLRHLNFFVHQGLFEAGQKFDFIFSHHVLEHVYDIEKSWREIASYGKLETTMLHIMPCGNKGSFEYNYSLLFKNGIDSNAGNRFFFEDIGHLRRLTSSEMKNLAESNGYAFTKGFFANQYYAALNWISHGGQNFIEEFTCSESAINRHAVLEITRVNRKIQLIRRARLNSESSVLPDFKKAIISLSMLSLKMAVRKTAYRLINFYYDSMTHLEWKYFKSRENGSEMFLFFKRTESN